MSIIGVAKVTKKKYDITKFLDICKAWIFTFPVCGIISYLLAIVIKTLCM
ncbi:MAG: hypothetical protein IJ890_04380 [Clostridia bacterium]|nr:hypothetical protein [Clostridia bacterium]